MIQLKNLQIQSKKIYTNGRCNRRFIVNDKSKSYCSEQIASVMFRNDIITGYQDSVPSWPLLKILQNFSDPSQAKELHNQMLVFESLPHYFIAK